MNGSSSEPKYEKSLYPLSNFPVQAVQTGSLVYQPLLSLALRLRHGVCAERA
jgi:hypothetical protein